MKKTSYTIQMLFKIGKIFSSVIFISCIIGLVLCLAALAEAAFFPDSLLTIGGITIHGLIPVGGTVPYEKLWVGIIVLAATAVIAKISERWFRHGAEQDYSEREDV